MQKNSEKQGVIIAIISSMFWGIFLVLINSGVKSISPLFFAGSITLIAAFFTLIFCLLNGQLKELKQNGILVNLLGVTFFIAVIPYILLFIGSSFTSSINTSVLTLSEIIFTVIFTHFIGEKTTKIKLLGAGSIFIGAFIILFQGSSEIRLGDILIFFSTITYPFGNLYSKRALNKLSPAVITFIRSLFGGLFLLLLSFIFENKNQMLLIIHQHWLFLLLSGVIFMGIGKILAQETVKRLDISKAIALFMTFPLFSLAFVVFFQKEMITYYQWLGIIIMMVGVYFSIIRQSTDKTLTKYA